MIAGAAGLGYALLFLLFGLPGLPLGFALFGRRHPASWIAGIAFGYALTTLAWWLVIFVGIPATWTFVGAWAALNVVTWTAGRFLGGPLIAAPRWTSRETTALCLLLLMVPILVGRPFEKLGSTDAAGNRLYRAYFVADFVWHTALASELKKNERLPRNVFLADQPVHYYWTYFRIPSTVAGQTHTEVQTSLKLNATATAFLFLAAIYLAAWAALPSAPVATAVGVALAFLAPSAEGLAAIADLLRRGHSLAELKDLNIDAVAAWAFKSIRIDNLPRAMWYNPQHSFSCALGLIAVPVALWGGLRAPVRAILLAGTALAASVAFNPLLGAAFCGVYGLTILARWITERGSFADVMRHGLSVIPIGLALLWAAVNEVGDGASGALVFGLWGAARNATLLNVALQLGPILIPIAIALWPKRDYPMGPLWPATVGIVLGLVLMHLVALTVNPAWVPFRGGQIFLVLAPALVTQGLLRVWKIRPSWAIAVAAVVALAGLPTSVIDLYNTQDVTNFHMSPGEERTDTFHWTLAVTPAQQAALDWIRTSTPLDAVVQQEVNIRGREYWSYIPTFGERRMATGNAISLLPVPEIAERDARVKTIYASDDAELAWREARTLGINYLYADSLERSAYPAVRKFDTNPELFTPVFRNGEVAVYAVRSR